MTAFQPASTRVDRCADVVAAERPCRGSPHALAAKPSERLGLSRVTELTVEVVDIVVVGGDASILCIDGRNCIPAGKVRVQT
jgi:hypothetical protein